MNKPLFTLVVVLIAMAGCSTNAQVYRDQPLVAKVQTGMSQDQVQSIGGNPLLVSDRTVVLGTCYDYMLSQTGQKQPFSVSFDGAGKVDHQGFLTCAQWSNAQQKSREPGSSMGGMGGSGY